MQMGLHQTKKLFHCDGDYQHNEKVAYGKQEDICNDIYDKGLMSKIY